MRVFVTGATGFIGTALVRELLDNGHQVLGLTRSDAGAEKLRAAGADVHHGDLADLDSLRAGAAAADAVIHLAADHANVVSSLELERRSIGAFASVLKGSERPLVITSGTGVGSMGPGQFAREDLFDNALQNPRVASEEAGNAAFAEGVNVSVVRLPQVHDTRKQGLVTLYIDLTRLKGVAAYIGNGENRWPAVHVTDAARLYRLALERRQPGSCYHAVGDEGVAMRSIAEAVGHGLKMPVRSLIGDEASAHFGMLTPIVGMDMPASSALTRERLGWNPTGPDLLTDLRNMDYSAT